jgi:hypothetical protein
MNQPIVMPRSSKYGNNYWNSNGPKVGMREVILYSDLEFDNWLLVETNPRIEAYCEQYKEISYLLDGKLHTTIPDIWTREVTGEQEIIEVKYEIELQPFHPNYSRNMRQIQAQREWCNKEGMKHKVLTEKTIRAYPIGLENRLKMVSIIKNPAKSVAEDQVFGNISKYNQTIGALHENLKSKFTLAEVLNACIRATYSGKTITNINDVLWSVKTEIRRFEPSEGY